MNISGLKRSTFYYSVKKLDKDFKNDAVMNEIIDIFYQNNENYGYRRITLELGNRGYNVNHKKVLRLMSKMNLWAKVRRKRKYSSYKGTIGKIADNLIARKFHSEKPNQKWYTDVTEFNIKGEKLYLSPILDGYNQEIISYNISKSPNLNQIYDMLDKAYEKFDDLKGLIFHSDQGWQYQHNSYQKSLNEREIRQSMSRKGNSLDNGLMENFFGILKTEMFYGQEQEFKTVDDLGVAIDKYIEYYNNDRIKVKLKGLSPVKYRIQSIE